MAFKPSSDDEAAAAITRLVDGTLSDAERPDVEAWAQASPEVSRTVGSQTLVKQALATGGPETPDRLLEAVSERLGARARPEAGTRAHDRERSPARARNGARGWPAPQWRPAIGLGALASVAAVLLAVILVTSGSSATPGITQAAKLAFVPATGTAPRVASTHYLDVAYHGVTFPNYERLNTSATGQLRNHITGRSALTVFYRLHDGKQLSYTVFAGRPLRRPSAARLTHYRGVPLWVYRTSDGLSVVTLVRHGRTCVLAAATPKDTVLNLAAEPVLVSHQSPV
ncbi:MAG: hypothetical protein FWD04_09250 [Conexibacteraceae bacterium]|nr:hypothetical protein [Conexibacteraceae bacterium]